MLVEQRECKRHGLSDFTNFKPGTGFRCKKCCSEAVKRSRVKMKNRAVMYKGGKCQHCSYSKCIQALEFHHIDPSQKDFHLGEGGETRSWSRIQEELDKCVMLCANCHREVHQGLISLC